MTKKDIAYIKKSLKQETRLRYLKLNGKTDGFTKDAKLNKKIEKLESGNLKGFSKYINQYKSLIKKQSKIKQKAKLDRKKYGTQKGKYKILGGYLFEEFIFFVALSHSSKQTRILESQIKLFLQAKYRVYANFAPLRRVVEGETNIQMGLQDLWNYCERLQDDWLNGNDRGYPDNGNDYPLVTCEYENNEKAKTYKLLITVTR
jgi:hypothetical protein